MATSTDVVTAEINPEWEYRDYVHAWLTVDAQSTWYKVQLAMDVEDKYRALTTYAKDIGVSVNTLYAYRSVGLAYGDQLQTFLRGKVSFAVAKALMGQPDRAELVGESDITKAKAEKLVRERKKNGGETGDATAKDLRDSNESPAQTGKPLTANQRELAEAAQRASGRLQELRDMMKAGVKVPPRAQESLRLIVECVKEIINIGEQREGQ